MNIKHVLMCRPTHFRVEYEINPWMKIGSIDPDLALRQWENLFSAYKDHGIKVSVIDQHQDNPDMVFSTDQALFFEKNKMVLSQFRYPERKAETGRYLPWFKKNKYKIARLPKEVFFEGSGDCLFWKKDTYIMGSGYRNTGDSSKNLEKLTGNKFVVLNLVSEKFYHIDTCLFILNEDTAFYYPPAFEDDGLKFLKQNFSNLIKIPKEEAYNLVSNSLCHKDTVFIQSGNPITVKKLNSLGYKTVELDLGEFMKSGGGIHCLTQVIDYF